MKDVKVCRKPTWFSSMHSLWVGSCCLLYLGASIQQLSQGRKIKRGRYVCSTGIGGRWKTAVGVLLHSRNKTKGLDLEGWREQ